MAATLMLTAIFVVSYSGGLYFVLGVLIAWPVASLLWNTIKFISRHFFVSLVALFFAFNAYLIYQYGPCATMFVACLPKAPGISSHNVVVTINDLHANAFSVSEAFTVEPEREQPPEEHTPPTIIELPAKRIVGESSGFFLKRLKIPGPNKRTVDVHGSDGTLRKVKLCSYNCNEVSVTLKDFPRQSFYATNTTQVITIPNHPGNVTINWTIPSVYSGRAEDILIWYHPSKSKVLTTLLRPFAGITSLGGFAWALLGIIVTLIITPLIIPAFSDIIKDRLKALFSTQQEKGNHKKQKTKNTQRSRSR